MAKTYLVTSGGCKMTLLVCCRPRAWLVSHLLSLVATFQAFVTFLMPSLGLTHWQAAGDLCSSIAVGRQVHLGSHVAVCQR